MVAVPSLIDADRRAVRQGRAELLKISPFLERGRQFERNEKIYFVGEVGRTWDFVATDERQREAAAIGAHFEGLGTFHTTLLNADNVIVAQYEGGELKLLVGRPPREPAEP